MNCSDKTSFIFLCRVFFKNIAAVILILLTFSCKSDPYLYDKPGFDPGTLPQDSQNPNAPNKVLPDYRSSQQREYYSGQQQNYGQQRYQQNYSAPQGYQPQQQYYPPQSHYPQQPSQGGSRSYSNPYAIPPSNHYPYYDSDQYYIPPSYYGSQDDNIIDSTRRGF